MNNKIVHDLMTSNPKTLPSNATVMEALRIFSSEGFDHLPVVDNDKLVGIVSKTDLFEKLVYQTFHTAGTEFNKRELESRSLSSIMSTMLITVQMSTTIEEAAHLLRTNKVHALPVMDQGELKGIITSNDLLHHFF